jgi:hypothetical protein
MSPFATKVDAFSLPGVGEALKEVLGKEQVPTNDSVQNLILTVLNISFRAAVRNTINAMVSSTITWANNGFDGNPAFVQNPAEFFGDIVDATAGDYISRIAGQNLCRPFQVQVNLSLQHYYQQYYLPDQIYQCSFTGITGNLQDFYNDFSNGGWQGWFSLTQNSSNNPYEVYLNTRIGLDSSIAQKLGIEQKKIDWGQGFKSKGECLKYNPDEEEIFNAEKAGETLEGYDPNFEPGECIEYGDDVTPGSIIKTQLDKALGSGQDSLINAKQFDELINSLLTNLTKKYVFGPEGLIRKTFSKDLPPSDEKAEGYTGDSSANSPTSGTPFVPTPEPEALVSCSPNKSKARVGEEVIWTALNQSEGSVEFVWQGDELPYRITDTATIAYQAPGVKNAQVNATITYSDGSKENLLAPCDFSVIVSPSGSDIQ